jgi:hypothetical protein
MMKLITSIIAACFLIGSTLVFAEKGTSAGAGGAGAGGVETAPTPQTMEQNMFGEPDVSAEGSKPDVSGDGINNATQVENPADIGRSGSVTADAPEPLPVEGGAGAQEAK